MLVNCINVSLSQKEWIKEPDLFVCLGNYESMNDESIVEIYCRSGLGTDELAVVAFCLRSV